MGAVVVCFNAPFDLSRLALEYRKAKNKNTGWATVLWRYKRKPDKLKPKLRIQAQRFALGFYQPRRRRSTHWLIYRGRFLDLSVLGWALRNKHMDLNGFLDSFKLKGKMEHEPTGRVTSQNWNTGGGMRSEP